MPRGCVHLATMFDVHSFGEQYSLRWFRPLFEWATASVRTIREVRTTEASAMQQYALLPGTPCSLLYTTHSHSRAGQREFLENAGRTPIEGPAVRDVVRSLRERLYPP